jgi:hypothetical protein
VRTKGGEKGGQLSLERVLGSGRVRLGSPRSKGKEPKFHFLERWVWLELGECTTNQWGAL